MCSKYAKKKNRLKKLKKFFVKTGLNLRKKFQGLNLSNPQKLGNPKF
jgi:hypothetical protein